MEELLMIKNQFNENGELVTIEELNERICEGQNEIKGLVGTKDGVYNWYNSCENETEEENQVNGELMEYIRLDNIKNLYGHLMKCLDEGTEELISYTVDERDLYLKAITRSGWNNTLYIYNYIRDPETDNVEMIYTVADISMFSKLFQMA